MDKLFPNRGALLQRFEWAPLNLRRAVSSHGLCATDLEKVPARHQSDPWSQLKQTVHYKISPQCSPLNLVRFQRDSRLMNLVRLYRDSDLTCSQALSVRGLGAQSKNTVYALDTTIDLCLSLFDWDPFGKA